MLIPVTVITKKTQTEKYKTQ